MLFKVIKIRKQGFCYQFLLKVLIYKYNDKRQYIKRCLLVDYGELIICLLRTANSIIITKELLSESSCEV